MFPCICGHSKRLHGRIDAPIWDEWCDGEGIDRKYFSSLCGCNEYVPDNLKYLEQCLKNKKGKGKRK